MEKIKSLIKKLKHLPDDRIGDGIHTAFEWCDGKLIRLYMGSKINGPMLQFSTDKGWTNCYSRGNFGKKYAVGGNWSGHTRNTHPRLNTRPVVDKKYEMLIDDGGNHLIMPCGIKGDIGVTVMDCSGGWTIWYNTAKAAMSARLTRSEIADSSLPGVAKQHLLKNETQLVLESLADVIEAYNL